MPKDIRALKTEFVPPGARASLPASVREHADEATHNLMFAPLGAHGGQGCPRSRHRKHV
ncbi:MAG: hypothetical protein H0U81_03515 [Pyrinomonadaceae bacterium]|nr:hypothetical protein [Pyrinomonadaceae bacterium]